MLKLEDYLNIMSGRQSQLLQRGKYEVCNTFVMYCSEGYNRSPDNGERPHQPSAPTKFRSCVCLGHGQLLTA